MSEIWQGAAVAAALNEKTAARTAALRNRGITPTLALLRVGSKSDDLSYEKGAIKRCTAAGVAVNSVVLPENTDQRSLMAALDALNTDSGVHGILILRPLPSHLDSEAVRRALSPAKDVDGVTDTSLAGVFTGAGAGFAPCTARAVLEILDFYGVDCQGKRAVVVGRSLVVGKPVAMLLLSRHATVTLCHTRTVDLPAVTRGAELLVVAAGVMESIGRDHLSFGQVIVDVGIHWHDAKGRLCGDVKFEEAASMAAALTPVPGGVGAVTTGVLAAHVAEAAERSRGM